MKPQLKTILKHLNTVGSISTLEAINYYQVMSLSRRICDLEDMGYTFSKETKTNPATKKRYKRYHLLANKETA